MATPKTKAGKAPKTKKTKASSSKAKPRQPNKRKSKTAPAEVQEKATDIAIERRVNMVEQLLSSGSTHDEIIDWCSELKPGIEKNWTVERRQAQKYLRRVYERWAAESIELGPEQRHQVRAELRASAKRLFQQCMVHKRFGAAAKALEVRAKLEGGYEPERIIHTVGMMTPDEMARRASHYKSTFELMEQEGLLDGGNGAEPTKH